MYYRRKIILALLQLFGGSLEKIRLQKLLFLYMQDKPDGSSQVLKPEYEFVPYKFGCFSWSANADLTVMSGSCLVKENKTHFIKSDQTDYIAELNATDRKRMLQLKEQYGNMSNKALIKYTYLNYAYFAINSEISKDLLSAEEWSSIIAHKPQHTDTALFTIGYEGLSLEAYMNRLLLNDVKALADVRSNPVSMKYGFSKSALKRSCESLDILYYHFPEVGIPSDKRREYDGKDRTDGLFAYYRNEILPASRNDINEIFQLLKKHKRIALTCFESDVNTCHRKYLAEAIKSFPEFQYEIKHIC
jgi:uncharacterized protein (DUF488 family)